MIARGQPEIDPAQLEAVVNAFPLRGFPYDPDQILNPASNREDRDLISRVDGWSQVEQLETLLAARARSNEPVVVVVWGGSGSGRSSLANYLVDYWARQRDQLDRDLLYIASKPVSDYLWDEHLWDWVLSFRRWASSKRRRFTLAESTQTVFRELAKSKPAALADSLQEAMSHFVEDLAQEGGAVAGIFEGINDPKYMTEITRCVEYVDACVLMTIEDTEETRETMIERIDELLDPAVGRHIQLSALTGPDIGRLACDRWRAFAIDDAPAPFDASGFTTAFDGKERSLRLALRLMRALLMSIDNSRPLAADEVDRQLRALDSLLPFGTRT